MNEVQNRLIYKYGGRFNYKLKKSNTIIPMPVSKISEDKLLIISDTHLGSTNENYYYLDLLYNYAINNNINTIIHGGDLMQGTVKPLLKDCQDMYNQAKKVINLYPYDDNIKNFILFGNHDFYVFRKTDGLEDLFLDRKDMKILGIKKCYLNWNNYLISISHHLPKCDFELQRYETLIKFCGHRHELHKKDNTIYLPTLSNDIKYYGRENYPGFLEGIIDNNELIINNFIIKDNKIDSKKLYLKKELNERVKLK